MGDAGTIRKAVIAGATYRAIFDTDLSRVPTKFENKKLATTGGNVTIQEQRVEEVTDMILFLDANEFKTLRRVQDSGEDIDFSYTDAAGVAWRGKGTINMDAKTSMENRTTVALLPSGEWA